MTQITVSDEVARLISQGSTPIVLVDKQGRELGKLDRMGASAESTAPSISDEELADLKRRMNEPGPGKTTKELLDYLQSLAPIEGR
jgi:hypothetical protein